MTYEAPPAMPVAPPRRSPFQRVDAPNVTYAILAVTVAVYLLQILSEQIYHTDVPALLGMKINEQIIGGDIWRLLTPMLLHGSPLHIGFNMYALIVLGSGVEKRLGHGRYLLLYVLSGFTGNVISFLFQPANSLGASTAIFGLLAAEGVFVYRNRRLILNARSMLQNVIFIAAVNLAIGLSGGIDNWGHLGGLLGGMMFSWFAGPRFNLKPESPYEITDESSAADILLGSLLVLTTFGLLAAWRIAGG